MGHFRPTDKWVGSNGFDGLDVSRLYGLGAVSLFRLALIDQLVHVKIRLKSKLSSNFNVQIGKFEVKPLTPTTVNYLEFGSSHQFRVRSQYVIDGSQTHGLTLGNSLFLTFRRSFLNYMDGIAFAPVTFSWAIWRRFLLTLKH